ncbi:MAG: hypothetical protein R2780_06230 [Crocinitomicaceae bacterium]|nr:hypothetical protein [Crocinitomicaceae bacterium]
MKKEMTKQLINSLQKKGVQMIRQHASGSESPKAYAFRGGRKTYTPDIVAEFENRHDFFAVEDKFRKKDIPDMVAKWILFGVTARNKGGRFYLVVNEDESDKFREIVTEKALSAEIITL